MSAAAPGAAAAGAAPPNPFMMMAVPHGSVAAASVVAAAFLLLAFPVAYSLKKTLFRTYILLLASTILRGVGFALHAAAQSPGLDARGAANREAGFHAMRQAGYGMAIGVCALVLVSWFKNAAPWAKPFGTRAAAAASLLARVMIPVVIISGPILGAVGAGLLYANPLNSKYLAAAADVREASSWALFAALMATIALACFAALCVFLGARRGPAGAGAPTGAPGSVWRDVHAQVLIPLAASLVLVVPAANRAFTLRHPEGLTDERYFYCMSALPEILNVAIWAPPLVLSRVALAYNWNSSPHRPTNARGAPGADAVGADAKAAPAAPAGGVVVTATGERA